MILYLVVPVPSNGPSNLGTSYELSVPTINLACACSIVGGLYTCNQSPGLKLGIWSDLGLNCSLYLFCAFFNRFCSKIH